MTTIKAQFKEIKTAKKDEIIISDGKRKLARVFKMKDGFAMQIPNKYLKDTPNIHWTIRKHDGSETKDGYIDVKSSEPKMSFHIKNELFVQISGEGVLSGRTDDGKIKGAGFHRKKLHLEHYDEQGIGHVGIIVNNDLENYNTAKKRDIDKKIAIICESEQMMTFVFLNKKEVVRNIFCQYISKTIESLMKVDVRSVPPCNGASIALDINEYEAITAITVPCNMPKNIYFGCITHHLIDGSQIILGAKKENRTSDVL